MVISLKVKTLDSQTYDFTVDDEISVQQFKEAISEKTNISTEQQRIIYCGRLLLDDKKLKDYDVNGKVVHLVERAPPSARPAANASENNARRPGDNVEGNVRGSPIFRAFDGMVLGAMSIPVTANGSVRGSQPAAQALNPSSTFCMNRIRVARHMLECANNIAVYLENPERGLNNTSLDILSQNGWTMNSTIVEVGISATVTTTNIDIPLNQNIAEAIQGAVAGSLHQNGNPNVRVLQIPGVFGSSVAPNNASTDTNAAPPGDRNESSVATDASLNADASSQNADHDPEAATAPRRTAGPSSSTLNASEQQRVDDASQESESQSASGSPTNRRHRTGPRTLGEVMQRLFEVQSRLEPFLQQYYQILMGDPQFEENDTEAVENSQRIFDRVSEALHYLSHAQHAISDLMLDLSQPTPRDLCCRPILVEQSNLVNTNTPIAAFLNPNGNNNESTVNNNNSTASNQTQGHMGGLRLRATEQLFMRPSANSSSQARSAPETPATDPQAAVITPPTLSSANTASNAPMETGTGNGSVGRTTSGAAAQTQTGPTAANIAQGQSPRHIRGLHRVLNPIYIPMPSRSSTSAGSGPNSDNARQANQQQSVLRLIQAVVDSSLDADVHVQINAPNLLTFGIPPQNSNSSAAPQQSSGQQQNAQTPVTGTATTTSTNSNDTNSNRETSQPRVTTATHPTTATQTRSTSRPHVHVANVPSSQMWNTRLLPTNLFSSFDRFLPCNSHHIRDENSEVTDINVQIPNIYARPRGQTSQRSQPATPAAASSARTTNNATEQGQTATPSVPRATPSENTNSVLADMNFPIHIFGSNLTFRDIANIAPNPSTLNQFRVEIREFIINNLFGGSITNENMDEAINAVIQLLNEALTCLPPFELPDYDSRASVENLIKHTVPIIINLIRYDDSNEFGTRLLRELLNFARGFFTILVTCIGRDNAERYITQITEMSIATSLEPENTLLALQRNFISELIRELDSNQNNIDDVREYLVIRRPGPETSSNNTVTPMDTSEIDEQPVANQSTAVQNQTKETSQLPQPIALEDHNNDVALPTPITASGDPLPSVVIGSEPWHNNFPSNWLPIITRDIGCQRRQNPQSPFSDAYISGMSSKRRKLVANSKLPTDVPSLLSDGVRKALQTAGCTTNNASPSVDDVSAAISTDPTAQSSYREALRTNVQERLKSDPDFSPDKFPNSSKFFTK